VKSNFINDKDIDNILKKWTVEEIILKKFPTKKGHRTDLLIKELQEKIYKELEYDVNSMEYSFLKAKKLEYTLIKFHFWRICLIICSLLQCWIGYLYLSEKITFLYIDYFFFVFLALIIATIIYVEIFIILISSNLKKVCSNPTIKTMLEFSKINTHNFKSKAFKTDDNINDYDLEKLRDKKKADITALERIEHLNFYLNRQMIVNLIYREAYNEVDIKDRDLHFIVSKEKIISDIYRKKLSSAFKITIVVGVVLVPACAYYNNPFATIGFMFTIVIINWIIVSICEYGLSKRYKEYFSRKSIIKKQ